MKRILLLTLLLILFTSIVSAQKPLPFKIEKKTFSIKINARKSNLSLKKPKNNNTTIIPNVFQNLPKLSILKLYDNKITTLQTNTFQNLPKL